MSKRQSRRARNANGHGTPRSQSRGPQPRTKDKAGQVAYYRRKGISDDTILRMLGISELPKEE